MTAAMTGAPGSGRLGGGRFPGERAAGGGRDHQPVTAASSH